MDCKRFLYSEHAIYQMFARGILPAEVENTALNGITIMEYPKDKPYPSCLIVHKLDEAHILHVVIGKATEYDICYVITAYWPDPQLWQDDFKKRK